LSEESNQILASGLQFDEAYDKADLMIDNNEKTVPTIGIMDGLSDLKDSGRIVVMTDSACIDSSSNSMTKCYWLFERFVRIATGDIALD
jgi:hypothetical protein